MAGLAGCVVGPDYVEPEVPVPAEWAAESAALPAAPPELSRWWQRLDDATLNALIDEAVAGNLDVATAKARVREARASYRQAGGKLLPSLEASGSATRGWTHTDIDENGNRINFDGSNDFQVGFDASWEVDLFGANYRGFEAAGYGLQAAEEELRATLLTLIGDVAAAYVEARGYQQRIALAERTAAAQRNTAELTRIKFDAGSSSGADVANAAGQAASTEATLETLRIGYAESLHRLGVLLGLAPAALSGRLAEPMSIPVPALPLPLGVPADLLSARPDLRQAERELAQATATIGEAEAARYPSISLTGSVSTSGVTFGDLASVTSVALSIGPSITIPIFNGGQLEAGVEIAEAQRDQSYLAYRAAVLTALEEVENAAVSLTRERGRERRLEESAANFQEAFRLARALYENGMTGFLEVLDAERSLYSAQDSLIDSRIALASDYIALNKALGGGWDGVVEVSEPVIVDQNTGPHFRSSGE